MKKLTAILCSVALLSVSASAFAAKDKDMAEDSMEMGKMMDTNHDGMISKSEYMDHQNMMWDKMPKNKDGMVMMKDMKMMGGKMMGSKMMDGGAMHKDGMGNMTR